MKKGKLLVHTHTINLEKANSELSYYLQLKSKLKAIADGIVVLGEPTDDYLTSIGEYLVSNVINKNLSYIAASELLGYGDSFRAMVSLQSEIDTLSRYKDFTGLDAPEFEDIIYRSKEIKMSFVY